MKFSVIMSIYNTSEFLEKAIQSILNQIYKDFEFIIVDDGSTDDSSNIINNYAKRDNRIKVIRNRTNIGLTRSLNKAIKIAQGEFIARQDGDDVFLPSHLERYLKFFQDNPKFAFCGCDGYRFQGKRALTNYFDFDKIKSNLIAENCFNHSGTVIRKEIFDKYGYYDESFRRGQDYELWCRLIYKYRQLGTNLNEKLIIRNMPENRLLQKDTSKFLIQRLNSIRTKIKYIKFSRYKVKCLISIFIRLFEMITLSHLMSLFSGFLNRLNI